MLKRARTGTPVCAHVGHLALPPAAPPGGWRVEPTDNEHALFATVRATCERFRLATTPRVAGGWVRDKLLGRQSADIDIAVDDCSGEEFAMHVNEHLQAVGEATHAIGVIKANPDQSKHLATAAARIHGLHVDFVQLRSESYDADSRIPSSTATGTPENDAKRRDFTINSMFYNIRTSVLEDLTGMGLADLTEGLLRTPMPAQLTFAEDPLRVLRAIRFSARFGFALDSQVCQAMRDPAIVGALRNKISNERVGQELLQCLEAERAEWALDLILEHGLADAVFKIPGDCASKQVRPHTPEMHWSEGGRRAKDLAAFARTHSLSCTSCVLGALLLPLSGLTSLVPKKKEKREDAVLMVVTYSLKLSHKIAEGTRRIVDAAARFASLLSLHTSFPDNQEARLACGRIIFAVEDSWMPGLELAALANPSVRESANALSQAIRGPWQLHDVHERLKLRPVLDGRAIMVLLGVKGPQVSTAVELLRDYCYLHPHPLSTAPEADWNAYVADASAWLKAKWQRS